ncbi:MAG: hypothetical protein QXU40_00880 [Candidatus Pacearchaeota archaeon]
MRPESFFTFFFPLIEEISKGRFFKNIIALIFIIIGIILFASGVFILVKFLNLTLDFGFILGIIIISFSLMLTFQIWFYRANEIYNLTSQKYFLIPIVEKFIRAIGESIAFLLLSIGIAGLFIFWFSKFSETIYTFLNFLPSYIIPTNTFLAGLLFLVFCMVNSVLILGFYYFVAELLIVIVDIENNTRKTQS